MRNSGTRSSNSARAHAHEKRDAVIPQQDFLSLLPADVLVSTHFGVLHMHGRARVRTQLTRVRVVSANGLVLSLSSRPSREHGGVEPCKEKG